ncbi:electron transfer flavoprotein-ubiquinone oxidoreductase [Gammaproteobacteria bacterium]|nr:electron transfer flavoprotein-ubiquinone oxidoreductase [Gammaproteobacteria bacterium]
MSQDSISVEVLIVGAGPAGLAMAISLKQRRPDIEVMVIEKGRSVGNHLLSGAVMDPSALTALLPNWQQSYSDFTPVKSSSMYYLTKGYALPVPHLPNASHRGGCIVSLSQLGRYLGKVAQELGVEILTGYVADRLIEDQGGIKGIQTGSMGLDKDRKPTALYQPPVEIRAKHTVLAEGAKGLLADQVIHRYGLRSQPQTYGLGVKEVWRVKPEVFEPGRVIHALGWPLPADAYGGGFIYHGLDHHVMVGMIAGLDAPNPTLSVFDMLQRFKHHPKWSHIFEQGEPIAYGARVINEGGYQSRPILDFPGGVLIGCAAGLVNIAKIKGIHAAIYSGMEAATAYLQQTSFESRFSQHHIVKDLKRCRNVRPWFYRGRYIGLLGVGIDQYLFRGKLPYTLKIKQDADAIRFNHQVLNQLKPDGKISFDLLTMLQLSNTHHQEQEPSHITYHPVKDNNANIAYTYFCPANVYEINTQFQISPQNCIHCKACIIRNPKDQIHWQHPQGGGGPNYTDT